MTKKQAGFSLLEVLVTLVILAIGLLGLAGLQVTSLKNNLSAYHRSQATQLAYDLADRMRVNMDAIDSYQSVATENTDCMSTTGCSSVQMAKHDRYLWDNSLAEILPSGTGAVSLVGTTQTITVTWKDSHGDANNADTSFKMSFQP